MTLESRALPGGASIDPMNKHVSGGDEAVIEYRDSNIRVVRPGRFVRCAVTRAAIPLEELKYWSVDRQEAYATPEAVLMRLGRPLPGKV